MTGDLAAITDHPDPTVLNSADFIREIRGILKTMLQEEN